MRYIMKQPSESAVQNALDNGILSNPYIAYVEDGKYIDWNSKGADYANMYFTIEALEDGDIKFYNSCSYSINDAEWVTAEPGTVTVKSGDLVRFKGGIANANNMFSGNTISSNVYGNILSLIHGDDFKNKTSSLPTKHMFDSSTGLVSAKNLVLPSTVWMHYHESMFQNCTSLTTAPSILPAMSLAQGCYQYMFADCTSLTTAPELPAAAIPNYCYQAMFVRCSKLNYVKCLATNVTGYRTTFNWLLDVSSSGTFVKDPAMNDWPSGASGIPTGWTVVDAED